MVFVIFQWFWNKRFPATAETYQQAFQNSLLRLRTIFFDFSISHKNVKKLTPYRSAWVQLVNIVSKNNFAERKTLLSYRIRRRKSWIFEKKNFSVRRSFHWFESISKKLSSCNLMPDVRPISSERSWVLLQKHHLIPIGSEIDRLLWGRSKLVLTPGTQHFFEVRSVQYKRVDLVLPPHTIQKIS